MSDAKTTSAVTLPGSDRSDYRGKCLYKTGKCLNERALKTSGVAHNLCNEHRNRQNRHQRKLDAKNRLHKRERRGPPKDVRVDRFAPYRSKRQSSLTTSAAVSDSADLSKDLVARSATPAAVAPCDGATSLPSTRQATSGTSSAMFSSIGSKPPQVPYPFVLQDFDGIVVPLPSYLEGPERIEFRSRIYQKVLDFISEECILRFGAKAEPASVGAPTAKETASPNPTSSSGIEAECQADSEESAPASSDDHLLAASTRTSGRTGHL